MVQQLLLLLSWVGLLVSFDQYVKSLAQEKLLSGTWQCFESLPFCLSNLSHNSYLLNMFRVSTELEMGLQILLPALGILLFFTIIRRIGESSWWSNWGFGLVVGGAVGNILDKLRFGSVIHCISILGTDGKPFWSYNFAECYVGFGVLMILLSLMRQGEFKIKLRKQ